MAIWAKMRSIFGCEEICKNRDIWRMLIAEYVGTLFLVLFGCASCVDGWADQYSPSMVQVALAFGVTIATMAQVFQPLPLFFCFFLWNERAVIQIIQRQMGRLLK